MRGKPTPNVKRLQAVGGSTERSSERLGYRPGEVHLYAGGDSITATTGLLAYASRPSSRVLTVSPAAIVLEHLPMHAEVSTRSRLTIHRVPADHPALDSPVSFLRAGPPPLPLGTTPLDLRVATTIPDVLYLPEPSTCSGDADPDDGPLEPPFFRLGGVTFRCRPLGYEYLESVHAHPRWRICFAQLFEEVHGDECPKLPSGEVRGRKHVGREAARIREHIRPLGYDIGVRNDHLWLSGPGQPI